MPIVPEGKAVLRPVSWGENLWEVVAKGWVLKRAREHSGLSPSRGAWVISAEHVAQMERWLKLKGVEVEVREPEVGSLVTLRPVEGDPGFWQIEASASHIFKAIRQVPGVRRRHNKWVIADDGVGAVIRRVSTTDAEVRVQGALPVPPGSGAVDVRALVKYPVEDPPLRPYQVEDLGFFVEAGRGLIAWEMALGKGQPVDGKVLTPVGYARIGDLEAGDRVMGSQGVPVMVTGVYPRGTLPMYRVTLNDGSSLRVDGDHLWAVRSGSQQHRCQPFTPVATSELVGREKDGAGNRVWRIPMVEPLQFPEMSPLPLDPYLLGVLLAGGSLREASVTFCCGDEDVPREVEAVLPEGVELRRHEDAGKLPTWSLVASSGECNPVLEALRELDLVGKRPHERFISKDYLFDSVDRRLSLLQGLLDTGGEVWADHIGYDSSSKRLIEDVTFLVESLGGTARWGSSRAGKHRNGDGALVECRVSYCRMIVLPEGMVGARALVARWPGSERRGPNRIIDSVEPAGEAECVCISVDAPDGLYVAEHCIVTHNTREAIEVCKAFDGPYVVVCPAIAKVDVWAKEIARWFPDARILVGMGTTTGKPRPKKGSKKTDRDRSLEREIERLGDYGATAAWFDSEGLFPEDGTPTFLVLNYEQVDHRYDPGAKKRARRLRLEQRHAEADKIAPRKSEWVKEIEEWEATGGALVLDEAHAIKKGRKNRADGISALTRAMPNAARYALTGTPIYNRLTDLHALLDWLEPGCVGGWMAFAKWHCDGTDEAYGFKAVGATRTEELRERLRWFQKHRTKDEVLTDLPPVTRTVVGVDDPETADRMRLAAASGPQGLGRALQMGSVVKVQEGLKRLDGLTNRAVVFGWRRDTVRAAYSLATGLVPPEDLGAYLKARAAWREQRALESFVRRRVKEAAARDKLDEEETARLVEEALEQVENPKITDPEEPFNFKKGGKRGSLAREGEVIDALCYQIDGEQDVPRRSRAIREFSEGETPAVLFATLDCVSQAVDLTAASTVVFMDMDYSPSKMLQGEARLHRPGQRFSVDVTLLCILDSPDERVADFVADKLAQVDSVLGSSEAGSDLRAKVEGMIQERDENLLGDLFAALTEEGAGAIFVPTLGAWDDEGGL